MNSLNGNNSGDNSVNDLGNDVGDNAFGQNPYDQYLYGLKPYGNPYEHRYYPAAMPYQGEGALLPTNPRIKPQTAMVARERGYDPTVVNAPLMRRLGALLIDMSLYVALITVLTVLAAVGGVDGEIVLVIAAVLGPAGFYGFRAAGDAIFEGSLGKHALGLGMVGPNGLPVSATDGLRRNAWILPSMIPFAGWFASAGLLTWIAASAASDPLGQGAHERGTSTRVIEKPEKRPAHQPVQKTAYQPGRKPRPKRKIT